MDKASRGAFFGGERVKAIKSLRHEHRSLVGLVERLERYLDKGGKKEDPVRIRQIVKRMAGLRDLALIHVIVEDADFYPRVKSCGDAGLALQVTALRGRTGHLDLVFDRFLGRWGQESSRKGAIERECLEVLRLLRDRVEAEERLFDLIERRKIDLRQVDIVWEAKRDPGRR